MVACAASYSCVAAAVEATEEHLENGYISVSDVAEVAEDAPDQNMPSASEPEAHLPAAETHEHSVPVRHGVSEVEPASSSESVSSAAAASVSPASAATRRGMLCARESGDLAGWICVHVWNCLMRLQRYQRVAS